jgi:hypothetical protein
MYQKELYSSKQQTREQAPVRLLGTRAAQDMLYDSSFQTERLESLVMEDYSEREVVHQSRFSRRDERGMYLPKVEECPDALAKWTTTSVDSETIVAERLAEVPQESKVEKVREPRTNKRAM